MIQQTSIESVVGTRVWTREFEAKHLALTVDEALRKAVDRLRREAYRTRADGRHVGRNSVLIGDEGVYFALKEEVQRMLRIVPGREYLLATVFPLCLDRTALAEDWSHTVRMRVTFDGSGLIEHLVGIEKVGWNEASMIQQRASTIQRMEVAHVEVDSREFACGTRRMATQSVASCLAVVLHDPIAHKGCLAHIDTDVAGELPLRYTLLAAALASMRLALGSEEFTVHAFGGTGWFDLAQLKGRVAWFGPPSVQSDVHAEAIVYDPSLAVDPVRVVAPNSISWTERAVKYDAIEAYDDYQDNFYLFRVEFDPERLTPVIRFVIDP